MCRLKVVLCANASETQSSITSEESKNTLISLIPWPQSGQPYFCTALISIKKKCYVWTLDLTVNMAFLHVYACIYLLMGKMCILELFTTVCKFWLMKIWAYITVTRAYCQPESLGSVDYLVNDCFSEYDDVLVCLCCRTIIELSCWSVSMQERGMWIEKKCLWSRRWLWG